MSSAIVKIQKTSGIGSEKFAKIGIFLILAFVAFIFIVPLLWILISAFKDDMEVHRAGGFLLLPETWIFDNIAALLHPDNTHLPVARWYFNSIVVSVSHTILAIIIVSMSAFAYAKLKFKGKNIIFFSLLFLSSFPPVANIISQYRVVLELGWLNTPLALIAPGLAGVFNIFLVRQFMYGIPNELLESAKIDGAGEFRVFAQIVIPLCKPILTVVGLFSFTGVWNDFLWPSIAIKDIAGLTLTPGLQLARDPFVARIGDMSAITLIAIVPMVVLFLCTQRYFIRGVSLSSGVKG
ncbi:MAG: carbohydrate ABC transporter permease [Oscillospiraceae bacterium]|nr:carbohydrate ABC transporter permease [Oscillospiraceae bacterium]